MAEQMVKAAQITTGAARAEGRSPTHDGEFLTVYYRPDDGQYIVVSNGGVQWTDDTEADVDDADLLAAVQGAVRDDLGEPADVERMGSEERDMMVSAGWIGTTG